MESVGNYLQSLRLARGVSLEDVARTTRVARCYLEALEENRWPELPAPAFTKGFIRAYCQMLGEPPDQAISRYMTALRETEPSPVVARGTPAAKRRARGPVLVSLVLLIALGGGLFLVSLGLRGRLMPELAPPELAPPQPAVADVSSKPVPAEPPAPVVEARTEARLVARTTEPTWIRVQMDNGRVIEELLPAGAMREWSSGGFLLTIGNAGGISLELNGSPLPPLGASGAVIHRLVLPQDAKATGQ
jgi:cytoskeletal protein RodZ